MPNDPILLNSTELSLSEGDYLEVVLTTSNNGLVGSVSMTNLNTSQAFTYSQDAPVSWRGPTWPALGNSAEWIVEAGTYIDGPQYVFPDWHTATILDARACYDEKCFSPLAACNSTLNRMTAVYWNDTQTLYTRSSINGSAVKIDYVEEKVALE